MEQWREVRADRLGDAVTALMRFVFLAGAFALSFLIGASPALADQTFEHPQAKGAAVDNCAIWGDRCGWGGAHQFCQTQGYEAALSWKLTAPGARTHVIGADRFCEGPNCVGFSQVVCRGEAGQDRTPARDIVFGKPMVNGAAADACMSWAQSCGQGGAGVFCQSQGYALASTWETYTPGRTYVIGSERFCEGPQCTGLSRVTCVFYQHPDHPPEVPPSGN